MKARYFIVWDAQPPRIGKYTYGQYGITLTEAKAEIVAHYRREIGHAREEIRKIRNTKAKDFE
jgi:hypothetical protein